MICGAQSGAPYITDVKNINCGKVIKSSLGYLLPLPIAILKDI